MCGITGRWNFLSGKPVDQSVLDRMARLIKHRGPDGQGVHAAGDVGFAHRRLAIIDVSDAGYQPMLAEREDLWITYNGEIYNFQEIRRELEQYGVRFRSRTDTEVLLEAYRRWGVDCLQRLRGMFAFAIWDANQRTLFIARDRVGKKPLSYRLDSDGIAFASEPKAFLAEASFQPEVDLEAISHYLSYQYVPAPMSAFRGVRKLPPAHYLLVKDGRIAIERYWRLRYRSKLRISEAEATREVLARLREAVRLRLVSDVPLGAFLSGGIDSSAIVALMAQEGAGRVKTFSIGFDESDYNELPYARSIAQKYDTDHREFIVRPDAVEILPKLVWHYNEPFADSSAIPTYYLAELTRRHVTVALNGDGGDESFAGYERYVANVAAAGYQRVPWFVRGPLGGLIARLPSRNPRSVVGRAKRFVAGMSADRERRYAYWMMHFQPPMKAELCTPDFLARSGDDATELLVDAYARSDASDFVDATLDVDVNHYLPDDLLVKVDIATMAHGLEGRSPFLDHVLMEFAASLPPGFKLQGGLDKKHILKMAVRGLLPDDVIDRRKMGFGVPIDHWFRRELREFASDILTSRSSVERGYFQPAVVTRLLAEHVRGERAWHYQLWNLLMLELWHRTFIDRPVDSVASVSAALEKPRETQAANI